MTDSYEVEYHLQSYFLYFSKAAVTSDMFTSFWKKVDLAATKSEVIFKYEIGLSSLFNSSKFSLGAVAPIDALVKSAVHGHKIVNPMLVFWKVLIEKHSFPFFKRELLIKMDISKTYYSVDLYVNVGRWKRVIENNSTYPVRYIEEFMRHYYETIKKTSNSNIAFRKRKILFLAHNAQSGGATQVLINFLRWLNSETDIEVDIIVCKESDNSELRALAEFGIVTNFHELTESGKRRLKERLVDDVAMVFSNTVENISVQKFCSFLDVPQVVYVHELADALHDVLSVDNNKDWIKNNVTRFIASAGIVKQNLARYLGIANDKVELIYKFIDADKTESCENNLEEIKRTLNVPTDAFVVGMCGSFEWKKSPDLLPAIAAKLCCNENNIHIVWLGANARSPLYEPIKFDLQRLGLTGRVHLPEKGTNLRSFFAAIDVFVMASREHSFPLANIESGMAGKPVVCFQDSGGSPEYVSLGTGTRCTLSGRKCLVGRSAEISKQRP